MIVRHKEEDFSGEFDEGKERRESGVMQGSWGLGGKREKEVQDSDDDEVAIEV